MSEKTLGQVFYEGEGGKVWSTLDDTWQQIYERSADAVIAAYIERQRAKAPDLVARCKAQLESHPAWQSVTELLKEVVDVLTVTVTPKPAKTRGQREYEAFGRAINAASIGPWETLTEPNKRRWEAYAATLPVRPVKSPGERLLSVMKQFSTGYPAWVNDDLDAAARELGIQECEA